MHIEGLASAVHNFAAMSAYRQQAVNYLRQVVEQTGKKPSALAEMVGVSSTTFTRPLNDRDFKYAPKFETLRQLSQLTKIPLPDQLTASVQERPTILPITPLPVRGIVAAGLWQSVDFMQDQPLGFAPLVADPRFAGLEQWAELIRGASMDNHYLDGDYVHVIDTVSLGYRPRALDHVIVERRKNQGRDIERTCKAVTIMDGRVQLVGDSHDAKWNGPLALSDGSECEVAIVGLVVGSYRPRAR